MMQTNSKVLVAEEEEEKEEKEKGSETMIKAHPLTTLDEVSSSQLPKNETSLLKQLQEENEKTVSLPGR
jgi:hypothetical protein